MNAVLTVIKFSPQSSIVLEKELKESSGCASSESRYWVQREFEDLYEHLSDPASRDYVDLITGENKLDVALQTEMKDLKKQYLHSVSTQGNLIRRQCQHMCFS